MLFLIVKIINRSDWNAIDLNSFGWLLWWGLNKVEIYTTNEDCRFNLFTCRTKNQFSWYSPWIFSLGISWGRLWEGLAPWLPCFQTFFKHIRHRIFPPVTCFSVLMQFRGGGHSRRRGWCNPRPPPTRPPTPQTSLATASPEPLPGPKEMSPWAHEPTRKLTLTFRKYSFSSGSCPLTYPSDSESE